jgi:hypothetical protein
MTGWLAIPGRALGRALVIAGFFGVASYASDIGTLPQLNRERAYRLAQLALSNYGVPLNAYNLPTPEYEPRRHRWVIKFILLRSTSELDAEEIFVFVDDPSGKSCVQYAHDHGPCA